MNGRPVNLLVACAMSLVSPAQAAPDTASLIAAEDSYTRAVIGRDIDALEATLSDDLIYVHASGREENKQDYLKSTLDGGFRVVGARITGRTASVFGKTGVTLGTIAYDVGRGENGARYMAVYRKEHGSWLLLRWQNAKPTNQKRVQ